VAKHDDVLGIEEHHEVVAVASKRYQPFRTINHGGRQNITWHAFRGPPRRRWSHRRTLNPLHHSRQLHLWTIRCLRVADLTERAKKPALRLRDRGTIWILLPQGSIDFVKGEVLLVAHLRHSAVAG
jgi:hypothetical protein